MSDGQPGCFVKCILSIVTEEIGTLMANKGLMLNVWAW